MPNRIACVQMTSTNEVKDNLSMAKQLISQAVSEGAGLVVLPEMFAMMGLDQTDKVKHREMLGSGLIQDFLHEQAATQRIWIVGGTIPIAIPDNDKKVHATCLVFNDQGAVVARYDKIHLFDVHLRASQESYLESQCIEPGGNIVVVPTPFGRLGLAVCYDVRFPELFRRLSAQEVDFIALPSAFTDTTGAAHWDVLVRARAIENLVYVVAACQTGLHPGGRKTYGHSMIVNPWGEVKASLPREVGVIVADIDLDYIQQIRRDFPVLSHQRI